MPDYTQWPTVADIQQGLEAVNMALRVSDAEGYIGRKRDAVIREVEHFTKRQFIAEADTRTYDGSGAAELEIDECIEITGVVMLGLTSDPGFTLADFTLVEEQGKPQTRLVLGQGSMPAWSTEGTWTPFRQVFHAGRQNVQVTGTFGYGATIPVDLWEAAAEEITGRLMRERYFEVDGRVEEIKSDKFSKRVSFGRGVGSDLEAIGHSERYRAALREYKRPAGKAIRKRTRRMI